MPHQEDVDLDLGRVRLSTGSGTRERTTPASGFESATVMAQRVDLVGTARRNGRRGPYRLLSADMLLPHPAFAAWQLAARR